MDRRATEGDSVDGEVLVVIIYRALLTGWLGFKFEWFSTNFFFFFNNIEWSRPRPRL